MPDEQKTPPEIRAIAGNLYSKDPVTDPEYWRKVGEESRREIDEMFFREFEKHIEGTSDMSKEDNA